MKRELLLRIVTAALAFLAGWLSAGCSAPRPAALRSVAPAPYDLLTLTPVLTNGQFQGWYQWPAGAPTNAAWVPEWSTNLADWHHGCETVYYRDGLRMTETRPTNWATSVFFRVRRVR